MKFRTFLLLICLTSYELGLAQSSRIEILKLRSDIFQNVRNIRVCLPRDYDAEKEYEVLYINDGQNLFYADSLDYSDYWRVDQISDSLIQRDQIRPLIIVGIDHPGASQRANEFLPWPDEFLFPPNPNPKGSKYPDFLINEVMPLINSTYKTKKGKEYTGIAGFSYGGLISLYALLSTDKFGKLLIESPSLYVHNQKILEVLEKHTEPDGLYVYAGVGSNELNLKDCNEANADNQMAVNDVVKMLGMIKNHSPNSRIHFELSRCGVHNYANAARRLPIALKFLYGSP